MAKKTIKKAIEKPIKPTKDKKAHQSIIIRWELLDEWIMQGLNCKQIADKAEIGIQTLARRCKAENGCQFGEYVRRTPQRLVAEYDKPIKSGSDLTTWERIDQMLEANCSGTEIASTLGIDKDFFYRLMKAKYFKNFSDFKNDKRLKGNGLLRMKQFALAMKGDRQMLLHLGKERLNQVDQLNVNIKARVLTTEEAVEIFKKLDQNY